MIIGKHGLRIAKGDRHGLLLPGVAVEHRLDAVGFLEKVCQKAGLPADAWQDDDAVLMTFQGHAIEGELKTLLDERQAASGEAECDRHWLRRAGLRGRGRVPRRPRWHCWPISVARTFRP